MSNEKEFEEKSTQFKAVQSEYANKKYADWDSVIVQLNNGENGLLNIKMMRQDMEAMAANHGTDRGEVMEMMVQALEEQLKAKEDEKNAVL